MKDNIYYERLVERYTSKKASDEELMVFFQLLRENKLDEYLSDSFLADVNTTDENTPVLPQLRRFGMSRLWVRIAVAASVVCIIAMVVFLFSKDRQVPEKHTDIVSTTPAPALIDSQGRNKAILTLSDGSSITLDSAARGQVAEQGNLKIIKTDEGQLVYKGQTSAKQGIASYNTIETPRGSQYQVVLPDGTKVWLNAASSLRFPTAFIGKERIVELDGESYFEVAHNASVPFRVKMNRGVNIQVIGTHFNIHAYQDEPIKTTLLEGSIKVRSERGSAILTPGQEVLIKNSGNLNVIDNADLEQAIAWKNGFIQFNRADIATVMRQVERWYDVDVVFEGKIPDKEFVGKVPANSPIADVLQILELSNIHFRMEGKKITVLP